MYIVVAKDEDIPVYTIKPEVGVGTTKRVHRNNIMNCNLLLLADAEEVPKITKNRRQTQTGQRKKIVVTLNHAEHESSDVEDVVMVTRWKNRIESGERGEESSNMDESTINEEIVELTENCERIENSDITGVDIEQQYFEELSDDSNEESFAGFEVSRNESTESEESFASITESVNESELVLNETEESSDDNREDSPEKRKSTRVRRKPHILTYDTVGIPVARPRGNEIKK